LIPAAGVSFAGIMNTGDTPGEGKADRFSALLRVFAKLGILRYGVKSYTYTSGRDRPAESLMNDVFNAERDLTTAQDVKAPLGQEPTPGKAKS
jgi:hypothetical protein